MSVAFAGEYGAYAELAAREYFGPRRKVVPVPSFEAVFSAVGAGTTTYGIVPIENSLSGSIHQSYDLLLDNRLYIVGEIKLGIANCLITLPGVRCSAIKKVYSHPQALSQCRGFLKRMKGVEIVATANTAGAVKMLRDTGMRDGAAIASMQAAADYGMRILARNIQDHADNTTRFIVLARTPARVKKNTAAMKTSVVFATKNLPGALFKCLGVFALRDVDLYKIESRPYRGKGFEYLFYLDFAGEAGMTAQRNALSHLAEMTVFQRILGSYPVGRVAHPGNRARAMDAR